MSLHRDTYAEINLKYLKENIETTYKKFKRPLMAVIKADAYGHGYREVATYIKDIEYLEMFAVATLPEAIELRELGITKGILILGNYDNIEKYVTNLNIEVIIIATTEMSTEEIKEKIQKKIDNKKTVTYILPNINSR